MIFRAILAAILTLSICAQGAVTGKLWGTTAAGKSAELFTLTNAKGTTAQVTNYGGIIVAIKIPDKAGKIADIVLGFDSLAPYLGKHPHFGCLTGRYANRIGGASFTLDGVEYQVTANSGKNHIHGGKANFATIVWEASILAEENALELRYTSVDGEEGFPGKLDCRVTYTLTETNELQIKYQATTDKPTVVNLTNHSYFTLAGEGSGDVLGHELMISAETFTATDDALIPTGELESVLGTALDFSTPHLIGERIESQIKPLLQGKGYDHNYVLNPGKNGEMKAAATVRGDKSGIVMEVFTQEPGLQFYSGNFMKSKNTFKGGTKDDFRTAFCLETQHFPNSPNQPNFPSTILKPGELYKTKTIYKFSSVK